jgi:hypothetical protein
VRESAPFHPTSDRGRKVLEFEQAVFHRQNRFRIIEVHLWFERKIPESADANIDQAERRMINADVAAAFRAIPAVADVAALESAEELAPFVRLHVLPFPQRERAHRRGGITPAVLAMTVTHLQRVAAHLDLHRSAVTSAFMRVSHDQDTYSGKQERRKRLSAIGLFAVTFSSKRVGRLCRSVSRGFIL